MQKTTMRLSNRSPSAEAKTRPRKTSSEKPQGIWGIPTAIAVALLLAACGGGGGGGSSSTPAPVPAPAPAPAPPPPPSLIPPAPAPAEVLSTEAIQLRPLQAEASWTYQGESVQVRADGSSFGTIVSYQNIVKHLLRGGGGVIEQASNAGNEGSSSKELLLSGQEVRSIEQLDLAGSGKPQTIQWPELRSPVRAGDQYTLLDSTLIELTKDLDGDGKNDAVEVAVYARVVGAEVLPSQRFGTLDSVRVDTFIRARAKLTLSKIEAPVVEARAKVWYAQGLGIVRQTIEEVPDTNGLRRVYTEQLRSFQAADRGLGFTELVPLRLPADFPGTPGEAIKPSSNIARQAGGSAFLINRSYNNSYNSALLIHLTSQGSLDAAQIATDVQVEDDWLGHSEGLLNVRAPGFAPLELRNFDLQGRRVDSTPPQAIDLRLGDSTAIRGFKLEKAVDGRQLWITWTLMSRTPDSRPGAIRYESRLWLRGFDRLTGQPLGDPVQLYYAPEINAQGYFSRVVISQGRVFVLWQKPSSTENVNELQVSVLNPALSPSDLQTRALLQGHGTLDLQFTAMRGGPLLRGSYFFSPANQGAFLFQLDPQGAPILASGETVLQAGLPIKIGTNDYSLTTVGTDRLLLTRRVQDMKLSAAQEGAGEYQIFNLDGRPLSALQAQIYRDEVLCAKPELPVLDAGIKLSFLCENSLSGEFMTHSLWLR